MKAQLSRSRGRFAATLVFVAIALWATRHLLNMMNIGSVGEYLYSNWIYVFSFFMVVLALVLAHREKPLGKTTDSVAKEYVVAVVPAYNEDPAALKECLRSLVAQTRPLQEIYLIDDGSTTGDYSDVRNWFEPFATQHHVTPHWIRQKNGGKRQAQSTGFRAATAATVFITVDSDSILDEHAIEELLKPFSDRSIQSVAGVVLAKNNRTNFLARITDLLFVTGQLVDRSMMSSLGSVLVNSGGLAGYRADLVRDNLDAYLEESFFGRHIEFSDDSMLTLYALQRGKTAQQPSAFVFTMMPDKLSHHLRQQTRWMKGSFIRSWWRLKYLPLNSFGFARQAIGWMQFVMTTVLLVLLVVINPTVNQAVIPYIFLAPILLGYAQALRYFSVKRSDESLISQIFTYLLTPFAVLWSYFVLRPIRLYAAATCFNSNWGTRKAVEVTLEKAPTMPLTQRLRPAFYIETRYEALGRTISEATLTRQDAERLWTAHYQQLSVKEKQLLWRDYATVQRRTESGRTLRRLSVPFLTRQYTNSLNKQLLA